MKKLTFVKYKNIYLVFYEFFSSLRMPYNSHYPSLLQSYKTSDRDSIFKFVECHFSKLNFVFFLIEFFKKFFKIVDWLTVVYIFLKATSKKIAFQFLFNANKNFYDNLMEKKICQKLNFFDFI